MSRLLNFMSRLTHSSIKVAPTNVNIRFFIYHNWLIYMSRFDITYVVIAIAHVNIGHDPLVKVDYENFNIILFNFSFLMENKAITI